MELKIAFRAFAVRLSLTKQNDRQSNRKVSSLLNRFKKNCPMLLNLSFSVLMAEAPLANLRRAMELFGHSFAVRHRPRRSEKSFDDATSLKSSGFLHCDK